jgi:hypothetical protein
MRFNFTILLSFLAAVSTAQSLPESMRITPDGKMLIIGDQPNTGLYDQSLVRRIDLNFGQASYWTLLTNNYASKTNLPATMIVDGVTYDSVGVRFKGQTSFSNVSGQKKSFNISADFIFPAQDVMGYETMNLNNGYQDPSFLRELFYQHQIRKHIPAAKSAYIKLYINGSNWGLYTHVQQLNKDFLEEWYLSNDGTNWRGDKPPGAPGGGGGWGNGTTALNYLGTDTNTYKQYYDLKTTSRTNPWDDLVNVCDLLNNTPSANLEFVMNMSMDLDRTLWFLASEIAWTDDDSYVYKGRMDYFLHYELETGRMVPQEYDGNSAMEIPFATSWSPFYNASNANYPLLNKLLAVPSIRQRYLAHMRTIIAEGFDTATAYADLAMYKNLIDTIVFNDPKKIYTYANFNSEYNVLRNFILTRRNYLVANTEVAQVAPVITDAPYFSNGVQYQVPADMQPSTVRATVTSTTGIDNVWLYFSNSLVGMFTKTQMFDDGAHDDVAAGDGIYGGSIPGFFAGSLVRYYVEAVSANTAKSVSYLPAGAEHNVFIYFVAPNTSASSGAVVINEIMASNATTVTDNAGEYEDWIELYNKDSVAADISGFYLSDNPLNLNKWQIPAGTVIQPNDYLIIWADEDSSQGPYHANFKLSSVAEILYLLDSSLSLVDSVTWGQQTLDMGYARVPNGTGTFVIQSPTYAANNNTVGITEIDAPVTLSVYPNPSSGTVTIQSRDPKRRPVIIRNLLGQNMLEMNYAENLTADVSNWSEGIYLVQCGTAVRKMVVKK